MIDNNIFGAHYFNTKDIAMFECDTDQLYYFKSYIGYHIIEIQKGDCVYYFDDSLENAIVVKGPNMVKSKHLATVIRGYMHHDSQTQLSGVTTLPYVNGCSTKQLFPPLRIGDPTLQYLKIPPYSKEQEHHIHSTFRVVLILKGKGKSIVGLSNKNITTELSSGSVIILEPMCPHHFETDTEEYLIALPLHVFSSVGPQEKNHPMFNGTVMI
ncbi:MAG: hypothetical protein AAGI07_10575 [Bacteroidota bacterium]